MDSGIFIVYTKTEDIYIDIEKYVDTRFKNKKVVGLLKYQLRGKIMKKFAVVTL